MPVLNRSADRFQRALDGERITDEGLAQLVETSRHLVALGATGPAADAAFVATLRERLMAEAARLPAPSPVAAKAAAARRAASRTTPVVVVVGRGLPRLLAGAAASAILVGGVVGVASRGAVPGQTLYPVKGWLDGVAVRLADNDLERGQTYLSQAQGHVSDARTVADGSRNAADINVALAAATDSVRKGRQALDTSYATTGNPQALLAMRDFSARTLPQLEALRTEVPAASLPQLAALEDLLRETEQSTARRIAACGNACNGAVSSTLGPSSLPRSATTTSVPSGSPTGSASGGATVPSTAVTVPGGVPVPGGSSSSGPVVGGGGGGSTVGTGGASVGLPTLSVSVPIIPSVTATVKLPTVTAGTGGVGATVPGSTLGPVTLPGVTLTLP